MVRSAAFCVCFFVVSFCFFGCFDLLCWFLFWFRSWSCFAWLVVWSAALLGNSKMDERAPEEREEVKVGRWFQPDCWTVVLVLGWFPGPPESRRLGPSARRT